MVAGTVRNPGRGRRPAALAAIGLTSALVACSPTYRAGPEAVPGPVPVATVPALAEMVPKRVRLDGFLDIGADPSYPPMEFLEPGSARLTGVDVDLAQAIADVLGLDAVFILEAFTAMPSAVRSGRVELGIAALSTSVPPPEGVDAVLYLDTATQATAATGSGFTGGRLCGYRVAAQEGTRQVQRLIERSAACPTTDDDPIRILTYETQQAVTRAVLRGAADAMLSDTPVATFAVQQNPQELRTVGPRTDPAPYGALTSATTPGLARAVAAALDHLIDEGVYAQIMQRYGLSEGFVERAEVVRAP